MDPARGASGIPCGMRAHGVPWPKTSSSGPPPGAMAATISAGSDGAVLGFRLPIQAVQRGTQTHQAQREVGRLLCSGRGISGADICAVAMGAQ